jgi:hypothetical protein
MADCDWCHGTRVLRDGRPCPVCDGKGMPIPDDEPKEGKPVRHRLDRPSRRRPKPETK